MSQVFLPPEQWYAQLPTAYGCAVAIITDAAGRVLLVKPNYRDRWGMPGGVIELDTGELPHEACAREVKEELGLDLEVGRLVAVDLAPPRGARPRPMAVWVFDAGTLTEEQVRAIRIQEEELDGWEFVAAEEVGSCLADVDVPRVTGGLEGRRTGTTVYLPRFPAWRRDREGGPAVDGAQR